MLSFLISVLANLISNQIEVWLPSIARRIIRCVASTIRSQSARFEEERLLELDEANGGLAKLWVALEAIKIPLKTKFELWRDQERSFDYRAAAIWIVTLLAILGLILAYPPHSDRIAAYFVVTVPLIALGVCWPSPLSRRLARFYERRNYGWRITIGGILVPAALSVIVAQSVVPPGRQARKSGRSDSAVAPTRVFFITASALRELDGMAPEDRAQKVLELRSEHPVPQPPKSAHDARAPLLAFEPDVPQAPPANLPEGTSAPSQNGGTHARTSAELSSESTIPVGETQHSATVTSLTLTEVFVVPLPEQPVPSTQPIVPVPSPAPPAPGARPGAPRNIRLIRE